MKIIGVVLGLFGCLVVCGAQSTAYPQPAGGAPLAPTDNIVNANFHLTADTNVSADVLQAYTLGNTPGPISGTTVMWSVGGGPAPVAGPDGGSGQANAAIDLGPGGLPPPAGGSFNGITPPPFFLTTGGYAFLPNNPNTPFLGGAGGSPNLPAFPSGAFPADFPPINTMPTMPALPGPGTGTGTGTGTGPGGVADPPLLNELFGGPTNNNAINDLVNSLLAQPGSQGSQTPGGTTKPNGTDYLVPGMTSADIGNMLTQTQTGASNGSSLPSLGSPLDNSILPGSSSFGGLPVLPSAGSGSPSLPGAGGLSSTGGLGDMLALLGSPTLGSNPFGNAGPPSNPMPMQPLQPMRPPVMPRPTPPRPQNGMQDMMNMMLMSSMAGGEMAMEGMEMILPLMIMMGNKKPSAGSGGRGAGTGSGASPAYNPFAQIGGGLNSPSSNLPMLPMGASMPSLGGGLMPSLGGASMPSLGGGSLPPPAGGADLLSMLFGSGSPPAGGPVMGTASLGSGLGLGTGGGPSFSLGTGGGAGGPFMG